jgi:hypothetical protein
MHRPDSASGVPYMCGGADMSAEKIDMSDKNNGDASVSVDFFAFSGFGNIRNPQYD